jgi:hypothetical protein
VKSLVNLSIGDHQVAVRKDVDRVMWPDAIAATAEAIPLAGAWPLTLDAVVLAEGDRVVVKDQADSLENGIYVVSVPEPGQYALLRAADADQPEHHYAGKQVVVRYGDNAGVLAYRADNTFGPPATGGAPREVRVNGMTISSPDGGVDIEVAGNAVVHADAVNGRVQLEVLQVNDGEGDGDDDRPVGWSNWPVGDLRWLPGLTVAPPRTLKMDGSYVSVVRHPLLIPSAHVQLLPAPLHEPVAGDAAYTVEAVDDVDQFTVTATGWRFAASAWDDSSANGCPHSVLTGDEGTAAALALADWRDEWFMTMFPEEERLCVTGYAVGNDPTDANMFVRRVVDAQGDTVGLLPGISSWEVYGAIKPWPYPSDLAADEWRLIDVREVTLGAAVRDGATVEPAEYLLATAGLYYGLKFVIKGTCAGSAAWTEGDPYPGPLAEDDTVYVGGLVVNGSTALYLPALPTVEDGVAGLWAVRYEGESYSSANLDAVPVGGLTWIPEATKAPLGFAICDHSYKSTATFPEAAESEHVEPAEPVFTAGWSSNGSGLANGSAPDREDGGYSPLGSYLGAVLPPGMAAYSTTPSKEANTRGNPLSLFIMSTVSADDSTAGIQSWRPTQSGTSGAWRGSQAIYVFAEIHALAGYRMSMPNASISNSTEHGTGGTLTAYAFGIDSWDVYVRDDLPADAADREGYDNWQLVSSVTRAESCVKPSTTTQGNAGSADNRYVDYPFGQAVATRALKFVLRDGRVAGSNPDVYPGAIAASNVSIYLHSFRPYEVTMFRLPDLPREDDLGNPGLWCLRLFRPQIGNAAGVPLRQLSVNGTLVPVTQVGRLYLNFTGAEVSADAETGTVNVTIPEPQE